MTYQLSLHAQEQLEKRKIPLSIINSVINSPQQIILQLDGTKVYQSQLDFGSGKTYLLRIIINDDVDPMLVVTVYKTSQINKYWRP
ncbi:MAG: DUF4258 domain-containing protein [Symploca sp. SIO2E6]|nr:DUF4258 domain-containing protein [Symploca sp. SIO2E6]